MTKELNNFIMMNYCPQTGNLLNKIVMNDDETALHIDSGYGEDFDLAYDVKEMACERVGIEYDDPNAWDIITEETA